MKNIFIVLTILGITGLFSCSKNSNNTNPDDVSGNAKVQLVLTDAPSVAFDALYLDIEAVSINTGMGEDTWVTYPMAPIFNSPVNILNYRNGKTIAIGDPVSLPAGKIEQIRLILGDNNTIVVDGQSHNLTVPSGVLKINLHKDLQPNGVYKIWVDFDAARSVKVHQTGNGKYMLRPTVKAFSEEANGQLRGYVAPLTAKPVLYLLSGADTAGSAIPDPNGFFNFVGLTNGTYALQVDADNATGYMDSTINNLNVVFGKVTDVGVVNLRK